jgi:MraZ protein
VFRGSFTVNLDAKGRLAIPAKYRERLQSICESRLVVTLDRDRCLLLYPEPEWEVIERKLAALPSFEVQSRKIQRLYVGNAHDVEIDAQGRILLPQKLREFASLDKRVVVVGQGAKFEIWDEQAWDQRNEAALNDDGVGELAFAAGLGTLTL